MSGNEQLKQLGYLKSRATTLHPDGYGKFGSLNLGQTTLATLAKYLSLDLTATINFKPTAWKVPRNINQAKPDQLIVSQTDVIAVIEHKAYVLPSSIPQSDLEQLQCYLLATKGRIGVLTDGSNHYWVHNLDPKRPYDLKLITEDGKLYSAGPAPSVIEKLLAELDPLTDELRKPEAFDASTVARSIWQDVYIATRQDPEKCFQTFVELFMLKLISDYALLPKSMLINKLAVSEELFQQEHGITQIEYYFETVRPYIKANLFPELNTKKSLAGLTNSSANYKTTKAILPTLSSAGGETSILNGHAFEKQPRQYNGAFQRIVKKLSDLPQINALDPGFKSRIYEQFLRRDMNTSKVSGKYFTPRNVVKAVVRMANVSHLHQDAVICDPACGVGGFITESLLELQTKSKKTYEEAKGGKIGVNRKFIGIDVLRGVICLAKSNMLIHNIELYKSFTGAARKSFNELLADTFVFAHEDQTLGTLKHPVNEQFDLVMANPPYVVSGTKTVTDKIQAEGLSEFYDAGGTGLESRFVNWITNSLKPGARAFIVLPKSMLARVETGVKEHIQKHCEVDALVYLPERTFYTTPSVTYLLAITKKEDPSKIQTDPVFAYYVRDIGETRDVERKPTRNDLVTMTHEFHSYLTDKKSYSPTNQLAKSVPANQLTAAGRWDIEYLWTPHELERLGVSDTNVRTYGAILADLEKVRIELEDAKAFVLARQSSITRSKTISIGDEEFFEIIRGERVTTKECEKHPGSIPVVASGRHEDSYLGTIDEAYLKAAKKSPVYQPTDNLLSVGATGAVGSVHFRNEEKWFLHDDALAVRIVHSDLQRSYVRLALQQAIQLAKFDYTAKLYKERLSGLSIQVPTKPNDSFDNAMQTSMAEAYERQEKAEKNLRDFSERLRSITLEA